LGALANKALEPGCTGMRTGTERVNVAALAAYRSLGATVDTESVFFQWDDLAVSFGNSVAPEPMRRSGFLLVGLVLRSVRAGGFCIPCG
jgi:hypothetical protein